MRLERLERIDADSNIPKDQTISPRYEWNVSKINQTSYPKILIKKLLNMKPEKKTVAFTFTHTWPTQFFGDDTTVSNFKVQSTTLFGAKVCLKMTKKLRLEKNRKNLFRPTSPVVLSSNPKTTLNITWN